MKKPSDNNQEDILKKIENQIEEWYHSSTEKLSIKEIEKLMCRYLGVKKEKRSGGSHLNYSHNLLCNYKFYGPHGRFVIHKAHDCSKNNPKIRTINFKKYIYTTLTEIIRLMKEKKDE
jgi:hypothetical protein